MTGEERLTHNRRRSLSEISSRLSPKQVNLRLQQHPSGFNELRHSPRIGVSYAFSVNRCDAVRHVANSCNLPSETWVIIFD
jgi:hypothetical protein